MNWIVEVKKGRVKVNIFSGIWKLINLKFDDKLVWTLMKRCLLIVFKRKSKFIWESFQMMVNNRWNGNFDFVWAWKYIFRCVSCARENKILLNWFYLWINSCLTKWIVCNAINQLRLFSCLTRRLRNKICLFLLQR